MSTLVIKYGGHAMDKPELSLPFAQSIVAIMKQGMQVVLVHGGGPHINKLLQRLHIESSFVQGLRVTDTATMEVVEMVLCGQVNKNVVTLLHHAGGLGVGISGKDASLFQAHILRPELGLVGNVHKVNPNIVKCLLKGGFIPVIAPVALGPNGESLNINADTAAGALAGALQADYFVLVSDVPGVLDAEKKLLPKLNAANIAKLKDDEVIVGGMIPKVDACLNALEAGCKQTLILDGTKKSSLQGYLLENQALGTIITNF